MTGCQRIGFPPGSNQTMLFYLRDQLFNIHTDTTHQRGRILAVHDKILHESLL